jgi:hypothetical protein
MPMHRRAELPRPVRFGDGSLATKEREINMTVHIRRGAQLRFIVAMIAGMLVLMPARAQAAPLRGVFAGSFDVSVLAGSFTGNGDGHATFVGRSAFDMGLTLAPSPVSPLCREVAGPLVLTTTSGDVLVVAITGEICLDQNANSISGEGLIEIVTGTGRFATASGTGTFSLEAQLDDSGVAGLYEFFIEGDITRR